MFGQKLYKSLKFLKNKQLYLKKKIIVKNNITTTNHKLIIVEELYLRYLTFIF